MSKNPFDGKTLEEMLALAQEDWKAILHRADHFLTRASRSEFLQAPGSQHLSEEQLKAAAMLVAGIATVHGGIKLHDLLPMIGFVWGALEGAQGDLKKAQFKDRSVRMPDAKGVH